MSYASQLVLVRLYEALVMNPVYTVLRTSHTSAAEWVSRVVMGLSRLESRDSSDGAIGDCSVHGEGAVRGIPAHLPPSLLPRHRLPCRPSAAVVFSAL